MLKRTVIIATVVTILGFSVNGYAQESNPTLLEVSALKRKFGADWDIFLNKQRTRIEQMSKNCSNVPQRQAVQKNRVNIARKFLQENAHLFQLPADIQLSPNQDPDVLIGQQIFNGLPVFGGGLLILHIDSIKNDVCFVQNEYQDINISTTPVLSKADIIDIVQEDVLMKLQNTLGKAGQPFPMFTEKQKQIFTEKSVVTLAIQATNKEPPVLLYKFDLHTPDKTVNIIYIVDANSGAIIDTNDSSSPMTYLN